LNSELLTIIKQTLKTLIIRTVTNLPQDVCQALNEIKLHEKDNPIASSQLDLILENIDYGSQNLLPLCQDTGTPNFFLQLGQNFPIISDFHIECLEILQELTDAGQIRPNTIDPISQQNALSNGGQNMPPIYLEIVPERDDLVISYLAKGGGAENISKLFMLSASTGLNDMIPMIENAIKTAGGNPCPPIIIGIGLGGDAVKSMYLAKKALLRPLGTHNPRPEIAELESQIFSRINDLDIGIMGLGGHSNCLDVRIEWAMRHPASFPVGMVVQCYCHRTLSAQILVDGSVSFGHLNDQYHFEEENSVE
jgi:fumarate hydratase subunit alpha